MLQINTGRFFRNTVGRQNQLVGVFYSNLILAPDGVIRTPAGIVKGTSIGLESPRAFVFELTELIEEEDNGKQILISHGVSEYLNDFCCLATFYLQIIASPTASVVKRLTNTDSSIYGTSSPSKFVTRFFDTRAVLEENEAAAFSIFVEKSLSLSREDYLSVMQSIRIFNAALHRIDEDHTIAYVLLVCTLESLAPKHGSYETSWADVESKKRSSIDKALSALGEGDAGIAQGIRAAIISAEKLGLSRGFREFVTDRISHEYLTASTSARPLAKFELKSCLKIAYQIRSRYLHDLTGLPDKLRIPHSDFETVDINRRPALTLNGLVRLTRHVIKRVVRDLPIDNIGIDHPRVYPPTVLRVDLAPQCWVHKPFGDTGLARKYLAGHLELLESVVTGTKGAALVDLREVLADIENRYVNSKKSHRPAMAALYILFIFDAGPEFRPEGAEEFVEIFERDMQHPSIESLVTHAVIGKSVDWRLEDHREFHDQYFVKRAQPGGLHAPRLFGSAMSLELAERYRLLGLRDKVLEVVSLAQVNDPINASKLHFSGTFDMEKRLDWREILLGERTAATKDAGARKR